MKKLNGIKVLIVDDHDVLREILKDLFESEGAVVTEAESVEQAWVALLNGGIEMVISDVRLSGQSGFTLAKKVQSELKYPVGFFLCTGYNDKSKEELTSLGVDGLFDKPLNEEAIIQAVLDRYHALGKKVAA